MQKCYIKSGNTYFSKSTAPFSTISKKIDISASGLVNTKHFIPQVLRAWVNIKSLLKPCPIKPIVPPRLVHMQSTKKRKLEMDDIAAKKRREEYKTNTISIMQEFDAERKVEEINNKMREHCFIRAGAICNCMQNTKYMHFA